MKTANKTLNRLAELKRAMELIIEAMGILKRLLPWMDDFANDADGYADDRERRQAAIRKRIRDRKRNQAKPVVKSGKARGTRTKPAAKPRTRKPPVRIDDKTRARIVRHLRKGTPQREICERYGISRGGVYAIKKKLDA